MLRFVQREERELLHRLGEPDGGNPPEFLAESRVVEAEAAGDPVEFFQPDLAGAPPEPPSGIERPLRDLEETDGGSVSDVVDRTPFPRLVPGESEQRRDGVANVH